MITSALNTDLYELTMMQGYFLKQRDQQVVFDMFFRRQPFNGGFTIFAGLAPLLQSIVSLTFSTQDIQYLESLHLFKPEFLEYLKNFKFKGDIYAVNEGTVVFPNEPIIRVHGSLLETQLIESLLLNTINFQSLIATKSARVTYASNNGHILEFGLRRAQGLDGALSASRAAFIGGAASTSNTAAAKKYNIPAQGTMAHSWVMSFDSELEAFEAYAEAFPENCVLLVDTYDTLRSGLPNAIKVFLKMIDNGQKPIGIRLDSGDLCYLSKASRRILDEHGLHDVKVIVSNELDEWIISQMTQENAPIDAWGVGTRLITGDKDPALTGVYKIVAKKEDNNSYSPCIKITNNPQKICNPGLKNIYRFYDNNDKIIADLICRDDTDASTQIISDNEPVYFNHPTIAYSHFVLEDYAYAKKLLRPVMNSGNIIAQPMPLQSIQQNTRHELAALDDSYKRLLNPHIYKVSISNCLQRLKNKTLTEYSSGAEID